MATLWNKGTSATEAVDRFTVGNDRVLDLRLARYDVQGSRAHIKMLEKIGLLTADELQALDAALARIAERIEAGDFVLEPDVEDIHSQVELLLTRQSSPAAHGSCPARLSGTRCSGTTPIPTSQITSI